MASLPIPEPRPLDIDELVALKGTPEYEAEIRRQMARIAEHDRKTPPAERWEPDWEALEAVWK